MLLLTRVTDGRRFERSEEGSPLDVESGKTARRITEEATLQLGRRRFTVRTMTRSAGIQRAL